MGLTIKKTAFEGWQNCIEISNGIIDLIAATDIGPRILRFGFVGKDNELGLRAEDKGNVGGGEWRNYGGHRLWHSPEVMPRTYSPDNDMVECVKVEGGIRLVQKPEPWVNMQKEITIAMSETEPKVKLTHKITNKGAWAAEFSPWSISVMATGGIELIPQADRDTGFLANRSIVLWPYSKMDDHRVHWGSKYIVLEQDPKCAPPFKVGTQNEKGWGAYFNHNHIFVKRFVHDRAATYPDFGASFETYTTDWMVEIESLGPVSKVEPEACVEHVENWELVDNVPTPEIDETVLENIVKKYIEN